MAEEESVILCQALHQPRVAYVAEGLEEEHIETAIKEVVVQGAWENECRDGADGDMLLQVDAGGK